MQSHGTVAFIMTAIRPFRIYIVGMIIVALIWALVLNIQPYIVKMMLNKALNEDLSAIGSQLSFLMGLYLLLDFIYVIAFRFYDWIVMKFRPTIKKHIGMILMDKMMEHSHSFYL